MTIFLQLGESSVGVETETGATVEAGVVVGDDGRTIELLGVSKDLIDFGQGAREGDLVAVGPDDTAREVTATTYHSGLRQCFDAFVGLEKSVQMVGIWLADLIAVVSQPGYIDSGMGEEVTAGTERFFVGE